MAAAAGEQPMSGWRKRAKTWLQIGSVRVAAQASAGTLLIFLIAWPPVSWDALSWDVTLGNPTLAMLLFNMCLLLSQGTGLAAVQTAAQMVIGSLVGGGFGIAVSYIALAAGGGVYEPSVARAACLMCLAGPWMLVTSTCRFRFSRYGLAITFCQLVFAVATAASYYNACCQLHMFTLYWFLHVSVGAAVACITGVLVLPRPAGRCVRRATGKALRHTGDVMVGVVEVMTGDVDKLGYLAAASGETHELVGFDSGLYPLLKEPVLDAAMAANAQLQHAYKFLRATRWEWDVYSRQHVFPTSTHRLIETLARATLSTTMMAVYAVQSGHLKAVWLHHLQAPLRRVAAAFDACCNGLADVLMHNSPVETALERLETLERAFAALSRAAAPSQRSGKGSQELVALNMILSTLFSAATRLRRIFLLLPQALACVQPDCSAAVSAHFSCHERTWELSAPTAVDAAEAGGGGKDAVQLLRSQLHELTTAKQQVPPPLLPVRAASLPGRTESGLLAAAADTLWASVPARLKARWMASLEALNQRTGVTSHHLALATQMLVGYEVLLLMLVIPAVSAAFDFRLQWAVFIIVLVSEPTTGASVFKSALRLGGTILGAASGLIAKGLALAVTGGTYDNSAGKFIIVAAWLTLSNGLGAFLAVRYRSTAYNWIIMNVMALICGLPGLTTDSPMPMIAVWRIVCTLLGVLVESLAVVLIFPVSAKQVFADGMASTLDVLALCTDVAFQGVLPKAQRRSSGSSNSSKFANDDSGSQGEAGHNGVHVSERQQQDLQQPSQQQPASHVTVELAQLVANGSDGKPGLHGTTSSGSIGTKGSGDDSGGGVSAPGSLCTGNQQQLARLQRLSLSAAPVEVVLDQLEPSAHPLSPSEPEAPRAFLVIGPDYAQLIPLAMQVTDAQEAMQTLQKAVATEQALSWPLVNCLMSPLECLVPHPAFRQSAAVRAQQLARHLMNVLASVSISMDSLEQRGVPLLAPHADAVRACVRELQQCLISLASLSRQKLAVETAAHLALSLEDHVQQLLVNVMLSPLPPGASEADLVLGLALLALLANAGYLARLQCITLVQAFYAGNAAAQDHVRCLLEEPTRWALDERLMELMGGVLGLALSATCSGQLPALAAGADGAGEQDQSAVDPSSASAVSETAAEAAGTAAGPAG